MSLTKRTETFILPYPPTANHLKIPVGFKKIVNGIPKCLARMILAPKGRKYYKDVALIMSLMKQLDPPYQVLIEVHVPDLRTRDLGNVEKASMDALSKAGVLIDDGKIDDIRMIRFPPDRPHGKLVIKIKELEDGVERKTCLDTKSLELF